jgi:hypothetical protein
LADLSWSLEDKLSHKKTLLSSQADFHHVPYIVQGLCYDSCAAAWAWVKVLLVLFKIFPPRKDRKLWIYMKRGALT